MSLPLALGCLWMLASTAVAMMPLRMRFVPGPVQSIAAPLLPGWIFAAIGTFAPVSVVRDPLRYFARRAVGPTPDRME